MQFHSERIRHPAISFQSDIDGNMAPYYGESGDILSPDDWQRICARVNGFYSKVSPEWIAHENERFQSEQCKMYEAAMTKYHYNEPGPSSSGWIYVLRAGDYYKIGRAKDPIDRYSQLATLPPWPTEIVTTFECNEYEKMEKELHDLFSAKRANGEWFALDAEDVELLRSLE